MKLQRIINFQTVEKFLLNELQKVIGDSGIVKSSLAKETDIKEYYIEFVPRQMESFDYSAYWKSEIKRKIPYIDFNFFYHYGFSSGTIRIKLSLRDLRKMKLEKLKIYE